MAKKTLHDTLLSKADDEDRGLRFRKTSNGVAAIYNGNAIVLARAGGTYTVSTAGHNDPEVVKVLNELDPNGEYVVRDGVLRRNGEPMPLVLEVAADGEIRAAASTMTPIRGVVSTTSQVDKEGRTVCIVVTEGGSKRVAAAAARQFFGAPVTLVDQDESTFVFTRAKQLTREDV